MFNKTRHGYTGTHARTQGLVKGKLIVPNDLPGHLKQSLFQEGGEYDLVARYSSEPPDPGLDVGDPSASKREAEMCAQDRIAQPRGFAMKIFGVKGEMFPEGAECPTQDIEFNSTPVLDLADAKTTKEIVGLRLEYGGDQAELYKQLEKRQDTDLQKARDSVYNTHLESTRQYSQTAYRFGQYVAKYSLVPSTETQRKLYEETVKPEHGNDILHKWLSNFHANHEAEYLWQFQLLENIEEQPVEYAGLYLSV